MTLVLLDTNAYLRLAKRIKPLLGIKFGQRDYVLTVLKDVEDEVHRNPTLRFKFPWFDAGDLAAERVAKRVRLSKDEHAALDAATSVLRGWVLSHLGTYKNPPSPVDCRVLAFGQIRPAVVVTDDLSMHQLADDFSIAIWHGHELLKKMLTAKLVSGDQVREIFDALEANGDLPQTWESSKHEAFAKVFGKGR